MGSHTNRMNGKQIATYVVVGTLAVFGWLANFHTYWTLDCIQGVVAPIASYFGVQQSNLHDSALANRDARPVPMTGLHHKRLSMVLELPPLGPILLEEPSNQLASVSVDPQQVVVGIIYEGRAVAIPLTALSGPMSHIAILDFGDLQMAVTHCSLSKCTRVLRLPEATSVSIQESTTPEPSRPKLSELKVGGLDIEGGLVLLFQDTRYSQKSLELPLDDCEFEMMPLQDWQKKHPDTTVLTPKP